MISFGARGTERFQRVISILGRITSTVSFECLQIMVLPDNVCGLVCNDYSVESVSPRFVAVGDYDRLLPTLMIRGSMC